jgi:pimeloyl-ACP methyl ester carboxylesterase
MLSSSWRACSAVSTGVFGGRAALWLGLQKPERVLAPVLESPAAIRPPGHGTHAGTPKEMARRLFAHRERQPPLPTIVPQTGGKAGGSHAAGVGPPRGPDPEARPPGLAPPTPALFGTRDSLIRPIWGTCTKR